MPSTTIKTCLFAPSEGEALRFAEALHPLFVVRPVMAADQISHDDLVFLAGWKRDAPKACLTTRARTSAPIVLLTDDTSSQAVVEALRAGADLVVSDEAPVTELEARVRALMRRHRMACGADAFRILRFSDFTP